MNLLSQQPVLALARIIQLPGRTVICSAGITGKLPMPQRPQRVAKQTERMEALRKAAAEKGIPGPEKLPEIKAKMYSTPLHLAHGAFNRYYMWRDITKKSGFCYPVLITDLCLVFIVCFFVVESGGMQV